MKPNVILLLSISALSLLFSINGIAQQQTAANPPTIELYPTKATVPVGIDTKKNNKPFTLEYQINANDPNNAYTLTNGTFKNIQGTPLKNAQLTVVDVTFKPLSATSKCTVSSDKKSATLGTVPGAACNAVVTYNAKGLPNPNAGSSAPTNPSFDVDYQLSFDYIPVNAPPGTPSATVTSKNVTIKFANGAKAHDRVFTVKNLCPYKVNIGIHGGSAQSINPAFDSNNNPITPTVCQSDSDCYPGTKCILTDSKHNVSECTWENPAPTGTYELAQGKSTTVNFPVYDSGNGKYNASGELIKKQITWSGGIAGRYNCTANGCEIADCQGGDSACAPAKGFSNPNTVAEFTLINQMVFLQSNQTTTRDNDDTYDITVINGITIPVSMVPNNQTWAGSSQPFTCGPAGGSMPTLGIRSTWNFTPPSDDYRYVTYNKNITTTCSSTSDCASGEVCGLALEPGQINMRKQCGPKTPFFWNANTVCAASNNTYNTAPFYCNTAVPSTKGTYQELYACHGTFADTCYTANPSADCCGCSNWDNAFPPNFFKGAEHCDVPPNSNTWSKYAQPTLNWIKAGAPLVYIYPYDDKSSTFTCKKLDSNDNNVTNYSVTFCPQ